MNEIMLTGWKTPQAYEQNGLCYSDEQGHLYTRDDFLRVCNGDSQVALQLFQLCYWQSPAFQFALYDESIPLPTLSHHSKSVTHWLIWRKSPTTEQQAALQQNGWIAQKDLHTWMIAQQEWSVPWGIAFRDVGDRDLTPLEVVERHDEEQAQQETSLTAQAQARHEQFKADMRASLIQMSQSTIYIVEQLPQDLASWNRLEDTNGYGLRALFFAQLAETPEALWVALDRLPANCEFTVTKRINLRSTAQVKGSRRGGDIVQVRSRESQSTLIPVFSAIMARINQEPPRERLLRRWREVSATNEERIQVEKHQIEWLPLYHRLFPPLYTRQTKTEESARTILIFCGRQSAYTFALELLAGLPNEMTEEQARAFLDDLKGQHKEARAARMKATRMKATPEGSWHVIESGRYDAFSLLRRDAFEYLIPGASLPEEEEMLP